LVSWDDKRIVEISGGMRKREGEMRLMRKKKKKRKKKEKRTPKNQVSRINSPKKIVRKFNGFPRRQAKGVKKISA
jgi:hypothetical protein